jgi:hypothetical protein
LKRGGERKKEEGRKYEIEKWKKKSRKKRRE